jgi:hypothetical protein
MVDWHPVQILEPAEWYLRTARTENPDAVIRRLSTWSLDQRTETVWYRVVTWARRSEDRELIGWCRTLEAAAQAAWDHHLALNSWQRHSASPRYDTPPPKPPATELLRVYREAEARSSGGRREGD